MSLSGNPLYTSYVRVVIEYYLVLSFYARHKTDLIFPSLYPQGYAKTKSRSKKSKRKSRRKYSGSGWFVRTRSKKVPEPTKGTLTIEEKGVKYVDGEPKEPRAEKWWLATCSLLLFCRTIPNMSTATKTRRLFPDVMYGTHDECKGVHRSFRQIQNMEKKFHVILRKHA